MPDLALESDLGGIVCGIDEVGRGPLAGPVVAAAVILDPARLPKALLERPDTIIVATVSMKPFLATAQASASCSPNVGAATKAASSWVSPDIGFSVQKERGIPSMCSAT